MKTRLIYLLILIPVVSVCQYNTFHVAMGLYDFDNVANTWALSSNNDPVIGCDYGYLKGVSDYGFNLVLPYHQLLKDTPKFVTSNPSKAFLDRAHDLGLKVILNCPEVNIIKNNPSFDLVSVNSGLNYYGDHPALIGWHIIDEPTQDLHFSTISSYVNAISGYNSEQIQFVNLFPNYANNMQLTNPNASGNPTDEDYTNHIDNFLQTTNANFLSVDHYGLSGSSKYFTNLEIVARKAVEYNVPYFIMFLPVKTVSNQNGKNISEFNYKIFANLVYGSKGLFYWPREGQTGCSNSYNPDCVNDPNYQNIATNYWDNRIQSPVKNYLKDLHHKLLANGDLLFDLRFMDVYHKTESTGIVNGQTQSIPTNSLWEHFHENIIANDYFDSANPAQNLGGGNINDLAISFLEDSQGGNYFWVYNKSINNTMSVKLNFKKPSNVFEILDSKTNANCTSINIYLSKGEAKLFKISNDYENNANYCNNFINNVAFDSYWANMITTGGIGCSYTVANSTIHHYAEEIVLKQNTRIIGDDVLFKIVDVDICPGLYNTMETTGNLETFSLSERVQLFPNPSNGSFQILTDVDKEVDLIEIYDNSLRLRYEKTFVDESIDVSEFESGMYFVKIVFRDNTFCMKKIVLL